MLAIYSAANSMYASISEVVTEMTSLSPEQIGEVKDFVLFLKSRPAQVVDESHQWTDEDVRDVTKASLDYASATYLGNELPDD
jgi:hypothetical protein